VRCVRTGDPIVVPDQSASHRGQRDGKALRALSSWGGVFVCMAGT
jgi:hypothetical protein